MHLSYVKCHSPSFRLALIMFCSFLCNINYFKNASLFPGRLWALPTLISHISFPRPEKLPNPHFHDSLSLRFSPLSDWYFKHNSVILQPSALQFIPFNSFFELSWVFCISVSPVLLCLRNTFLFIIYL